MVDAQESAREAILLVDDDPNVLSGYRRQLGRRYRLLTAAGGEEALALLDGESAAVAVVVADMRMPKMNGVQLLAEVEKRRPEAVRMMLTGNVDQETAVEAVNRGHVFRFINKPAPVEQVIEALETALTRYRLAKAEREVVRQAEVIRAALERERAAAKQQRDFVGMVSHEFRTPLAIIDSAVEILSGPYQINEQQRVKRFKMIRDSVRRLNDLVDSVLDFTRIDGGALKFQPETLDLPALLRVVAERVETTQSACRVALSLPNQPLAIIGDPRLLDHVFANLIDNAIKYSPGKDYVFVNLEAAADGGARVAVVDQGIGVPAEEIPKVFDRFYRASTASGIHGTGIGLYIVDQFLRLHGGRATLDSKVGVGSTFTVYLPAGKAG